MWLHMQGVVLCAVLYVQFGMNEKTILKLSPGMDKLSLLYHAKKG